MASPCCGCALAAQGSTPAGGPQEAALISFRPRSMGGRCAPGPSSVRIDVPRPLVLPSGPRIDLRQEVAMPIPQIVTRRRFIQGAAAALAAGGGVGLYTWRVEPHWVEVVRRDL